MSSREKELKNTTTPRLTREPSEVTLESEHRIWRDERAGSMDDACRVLA